MHTLIYFVIVAYLSIQSLSLFGDNFNFCLTAYDSFSSHHLKKQMDIYVNKLIAKGRDFMHIQGENKSKTILMID